VSDHSTCVTLHRDSWELVLNIIGNEIPAARTVITREWAGQQSELVSIEGKTVGWRKVAELLREDGRTTDLGRMIRLQCAAAETEDW
jgi:hypothetical protein